MAATGWLLCWPQPGLSLERSPLVHKASFLRVNRKDYKAAVEMLLSASDSDKQDPAYDDELACSLICDGRNDQTIAHCDSALVKRPRDEVLYRCRALAYKNKGEYQKAIEDLSKLVALDPLIPAKYTERAALYKLMGNYSMAQKDTTKAANIQRYSALALDDKSLQMTILLKEGHFQEAQRLLPDYLVGQPHKIFYLSDIAKLFASADCSEAAIKCGLRYLQLSAQAKSSDPLRTMREASETSVRELLVAQYLNEKKTDRALAIANEGITQLEPLTRAKTDENGESHRAQVNLSRMLVARAQVNIASGKKESAREDLERSLSLVPDSQHAAELLKKIKSKAM